MLVVMLMSLYHACDVGLKRKAPVASLVPPMLEARAARVLSTARHAQSIGKQQVSGGGGGGASSPISARRAAPFRRHRPAPDG